VAPVAASSSPVTDELDRLFRRLIWNLADLDPSRVHGPVEVSELCERLVPYRTHRTQLAIDTHEDYEMTVLRLLAGERGYAFVEPEEAREAMEHELAEVNPDPAFFHHFPTAKVTFDAGHVRAALGMAAPGQAAAEPPDAGFRGELEAGAEAGTSWFPEGSAGEPETGGEQVAPAGEEEANLPFALEEEATGPEAVSPRFGSAPCAFCGGELPVGRAVIFCPHCGQNVGVVHCPACGSELDVGWRFCITCGRQMSALG
jgi:hypothetical protein